MPFHPCQNALMTMGGGGGGGGEGLHVKHVYPLICTFYFLSTYNIISLARGKSDVLIQREALARLKVLCSTMRPLI